MAKLWSIGGRWLLEPTRSPTLVRIARGLRHTGKPFIDVCTWLIRYGPGDAKTQARLLLADFYAGLGDTATASSYLARARVKGHSDEAVRVKARIDLADRKPATAAEGLMTLREAGQDDLLLLLDAVRSAADPKRVRSAADYCDRQFKKSPGTLPVYIRLADLLVEAGQRTEAVRYYREALDQKSVPGNGQRSEREWAHYRIAELSAGAERAESLKSLRTSTGAVGRFAEAELRSAALRRKVE
jgi:predicted Zn-dependent protease